MKKKISALVRAKIEVVLRSDGFTTAADDLFFVRGVGDLVQSIFFSKTHYKDEYNVVCSLVDSDNRFAGEDLLAGGESRERIMGAPARFALSPIAPFQNTYAWTFAEESDALTALEEIVPLIEAVALPVLSKVGSSTRLRQVQEPGFAEQAQRLAVSLLAAELPASGFRPSDIGEFLWKKNGEIFAIVLPAVVGFGNFLQVYVVLWSPLLQGTAAAPDAPPTNFSRVSFACLSTEGVTAGGVHSLWPVDIDAERMSGLEGVLESLSGNAFATWLQEHQTVASLLDVVSDDLRPYVRREIELAIAGTKAQPAVKFSMARKVGCT